LHINGSFLEYMNNNIIQELNLICKLTTTHKDKNIAIYPKKEPTGKAGGSPYAGPALEY